MNRLGLIFGLLISAISFNANAANSAANSPTQSQVTAPAVNATITIKRLTKDDWELYYQFSEEIDALHFRATHRQISPRGLEAY